MQKRLTMVIGAVAIMFAGAASAEQPLHYDRISLQANATQRISNDWMTALLAVQVQARDPATVASRINDVMKWALGVVGDSAVIRHRTGNYQTYPEYNKGVVRGWRGSQELVLEGSDFGAIGLLVGRLQERLQVRSMSFSVAPESRSESEDKLLITALERFKHRARLVNGNLGGKNYRIVDITINTSGGGSRPVPMLRAMAADMESAAAPSLAGGESTLSVTVSGSVEIQR